MKNIIKSSLLPLILLVNTSLQAQSKTITVEDTACQIDTLKVSAERMSLDYNLNGDKSDSLWQMYNVSVWGHIKANYSNSFIKLPCDLEEIINSPGFITGIGIINEWERNKLKIRKGNYAPLTTDEPKPINYTNLGCNGCPTIKMLPEENCISFSLLQFYTMVELKESKDNFILKTIRKNENELKKVYNNNNLRYNKFKR